MTDFAYLTRELCLFRTGIVDEGNEAFLSVWKKNCPLSVSRGSLWKNIMGG